MPHTVGSSQSRTLPDSVPERYALVQDTIAAAAKKAGRSPAEIILVAVTKSAEPEQIRALLDLGHQDFGENRAQQLVQHAAMVEEYLARLRVLPSTRKSATGKGKAQTAPPPPTPLKPRWHMIGHLQRNKARKVVEFVRLIHSVDSLRLAEELHAIALRKDQAFDVLVQVNCSGEKSKYGCPVPAALPLAEQIDTMINVRVRGLMTMAPYSNNPEDSRLTFARCRELYEELRTSNISRGNIDLLSMGMTGDYEVAISEGANLVRIGTALFGESKHPQSDDDED